jgi:hypothetical protein
MWRFLLLYLLNVVLPSLDLITDIFFSGNMFIRGRMTIFGLSVGIIFFPTLLEYASVIWDPIRRRILEEHLQAFFSQLHIIYLGYKNATATEITKAMEDRFSKKKIIVVLGENWFEAMLQTYILWNERPAY